MLKQWKKKDGTYDLPYDEYHMVDAVRHSWLAALSRSPAACRLQMDDTDPSKETPSLRMGRALHAATLEPLSFEQQFKQFQHNGNTKSGKEERAELREQGVTGLNETEWASVTGMAESLQTLARFRALLNKATMLEKAFIWTRKDRKCKSRIDMGRDSVFLCDIKTCSNLKRFSPYHVTDYGYHRQAAWYLSGYQFLGLQVPQHMYFAVVANTPPHESAVFRLTVESMGTGVDEVNNLFEQFLQCERDRKWTRHEENLLTATSFPPREMLTP
jgi:hypothetical protein